MSSFSFRLAICNLHSTNPRLVNWNTTSEQEKKKGRVRSNVVVVERKFHFQHCCSVSKKTDLAEKEEKITLEIEDDVFFGRDGSHLVA